MLLLTPVGLLGLLLFAVVLGVTVLPPVYAVTALLSGQFMVALAAIIARILWLRYGRPIRKFAFEGFEHASL